MKASFFIPCIPPKATRQQKGVVLAGGRPRFFKKANVAHAERDLISLLLTYRPADFACIASGPVHVFLRFCWPYRKSEPRTRTETGDDLPCDTRPDMDNLSKMMLDAMTRCRFWTDDAQVSDLVLSKSWGPTPGIEVKVIALSEQN